MESKESAEAFKNLIQTSLEVTLASIHVLKAIRGSGWKVLVEGVRLHPGLRLDDFAVLKSDLDEASREDIRVMWDALDAEDGEVIVIPDLEEYRSEIVRKTEEGEGLTRLT